MAPANSIRLRRCAHSSASCKLCAAQFRGHPSTNDKDEVPKHGIDAICLQKNGMCADRYTMQTRPMTRSLCIFLLLQVLDFATTAIALAMGGREQNPFVGHFLAIGPIQGLIVSKLIV